MPSSPHAGSDDGAVGPCVSLGSASQVPVGSAVIFAGQKVAVTQPTPGTYRAFSALCTHIGCLMDLVTDDHIVCRCNGSRFSVADGSVQSGPAEVPLPRVMVRVEDGQLFVGERLLVGDD